VELPLRPLDAGGLDEALPACPRVVDRGVLPRGVALRPVEPLLPLRV
jgi:hypothetical protein